MLDEGVHEGIVREWHEDDGWGVVEVVEQDGFACRATRVVPA
jgi:hypothetical protein